MGRRTTSSTFSWADGVASVPVRQRPLALLAQDSVQARWGFSRAELALIQAHFRNLGRDPSDVEIAGIAQSWSEHCSYKSSRRFLRKAFAPLQRDRRVLGTGDAGVMRLTKGFAYALRIESHNHPSAIEPYGGAATGIGGILRDVLAVGAEPIACADPLFFGDLDTPASEVPRGVRSPRALMDGVVAGIRDYGNRVGVPTVSGSIGFSPEFVVNPLVNVGCVGVLPQARLRPNRAQAAGNKLLLAGGLTGRDGLGGVAFASQELVETSETESRGAVQLGNPILKEPLIHACLEAYDLGLVRGVKDLGGGGLATASGELVHAGGFGSSIDLDHVPLRETGLRPWEVWISESQERMLLELKPGDVDRLLSVFRKFDVPAAVIGEVVPGRQETIRSGGRVAAQLDLGFRLEPPLALRRTRRPNAEPRGEARVPSDALGSLLEELLLRPEVLSREPILRLYDHEVQGRTIVKPLHGRPATPSHGDATVLEPVPGSRVGLAVTVAANPFVCRLSSKLGASWVVEEAARNLYAVGARPDALSNCLNFGNPEDPGVLGEFAASVDSLARTCRELGIAVPSGNVSFYNGGMGRAIPATPVVLATGLLPDFRRSVTSDLKGPGNPLYLLGPNQPELGGSLYARLRGLEPLRVPVPDPKGLRRRGELLVRAMGRGLVRSAHDLSDGGLGVALAEMAFGGALGFDVDLGAIPLDSPGQALVAEGGSRWALEILRGREREFERLLRGEPLVHLGSVVEESGRLRVQERTVAELDLRALYPRWREGLGAAWSPAP